MNISQNPFDKAAIALSALCALHCLALPIVASTLPLVSTWNLEGEVVHQSLLFFVIPTSILALYLGCRKHRSYWLSLPLSLGFFLMVTAVFLGHSFLGEAGEKALTLAGAAMLAVGHWLNYRLCLNQNDCCST